eukprot:s393_g10.t1
MEVGFLASGETLAVLDADGFEGKTAKAVKQTLADKVGISSFKQKILLEQDSSEILDYVLFASSASSLPGSNW